MIYRFRWPHPLPTSNSVLEHEHFLLRAIVGTYFIIVAIFQIDSERFVLLLLLFSSNKGVSSLIRTYFLVLVVQTLFYALLYTAANELHT